MIAPDHSEDIRAIRRDVCCLKGTDLEIIDAAVERGAITHALFDHDGTISLLRAGWETVMETVMIHAILGERASSVSADEYRKVVEQVRLYIDQSTGLQTLLQMQRLVEMVREAGYLASKDILDAQGYKNLYNDALMELVNARRDRVVRGELDVADCTVRGSVDFLRELRMRGVTLFLASGTDEADVKEEAALLGYADLFDGGVHGAVGDVSKYSKKMVIDRIIRDNGLDGPQLLCVGDGPVEIREAKKRGGIAVGVASDESRGFGLNEEKRTRLIRAGADIVAPDFSQRKLLLQYLFENAS